MLSCLEGVTYAEIAGNPRPVIGTNRHRTRSSARGDQRRPVRGARCARYHHLAGAGRCGRFPRSSPPRQEPRATTAIGLGSSELPAVTMLAVLVDGRRDASAVCRAAEIRSMDVLPHRSTNARLVHPEPDRRTRLGNHDSARRAAQRRPVLSGSRRCRCYLGSSVAEEANTVRVGTRSANYAERVWPNGGGAMLWWEYADTAWVIIECGRVSNPRKTLPELASHVTLTPESGPAAVPYSFAPPAL